MSTTAVADDDGATVPPELGRWSADAVAAEVPYCGPRSESVTDFGDQLLIVCYSRCSPPSSSLSNCCGASRVVQCWLG